MRCISALQTLAGRLGVRAMLQELIAEFGAAFLTSELGLPSDPRRDNSPYIASWLTAFKGDKRAIFSWRSKSSTSGRPATDQEALDTACMAFGREQAATDPGPSLGAIWGVQSGIFRDCTRYVRFSESCHRRS
jgi:hypothetical protein